MIYICPSCLTRSATPGKCRQCRRLDYRQDRAAQLRSTKAWQAAREQAKRRDAYACVVCGSNENLEVDHIVPLRDGGSAFSLDNLRTVCREHNPRGAVF